MENKLGPGDEQFLLQQKNTQHQICRNTCELNTKQSEREREREVGDGRSDRCSPAEAKEQKTDFPFAVIGLLKLLAQNSVTGRRCRRDLTQQPERNGCGSRKQLIRN